MSIQEYQIGAGSQVLIGRLKDVSGTPTMTYQRLEDLDAFKVPSTEIDQIETTNHDSVGRYREYIQGLRKNSSATIGGLYEPGTPNDVLLKALMGAYETVNILYKIKKIDGTYENIVYKGILTKYDRDIPFDSVKKWEAEFTINALVDENP